MRAVWAWCWLAALLAPAVARAQGTITLRPVARVEAAAPITLADIADLIGDEAQKLAAVRVDGEPLPDGGDGWLTVSVERVRSVLRTRKDANWGKLTLMGKSCAVRRLDPPKAEEPAAQPVVQPAPAEEAWPVGATVRPLVAAKISEVLGVGPDDLRLTFDQGDKALLDLAMTGRRAEIQPVGSSDRMPMQVTVFEADRIVTSGTVRVDVKVKRAVLIVRQALSRGQKIGPDDFSTDTQWLAPKAKPATTTGVIGSVAKSSVRSGKMLEEGDIESPVIVRKGDLVTVHCLSGLVKLETVARATGPGRDGDVVNFTTQDGKRTFQARMSGRGRAVALSDGEAPQGDRP